MTKNDQLFPTSEMLTVDDDCYLERCAGAEDAEISSNPTTSSQCTRADKPFPDLLSDMERRGQKEMMIRTSQQIQITSLSLSPAIILFS